VIAEMYRIAEIDYQIVELPVLKDVKAFQNQRVDNNN
jgi:hypothetical protein